jgi:hypothetical protein
MVLTIDLQNNVDNYVYNISILKLMSIISIIITIIIRI